MYNDLDKKVTPKKVDLEEDNMERQELDEIARSEGGLVAVTKVIWPQATIMTTSLLKSYQIFCLIHYCTPSSWLIDTESRQKRTMI